MLKTEHRRLFGRERGRQRLPSKPDVCWLRTSASHLLFGPLWCLKDARQHERDGRHGRDGHDRNAHGFGASECTEQFSGFAWVGQGDSYVRVILRCSLCQTLRTTLVHMGGEFWVVPKGCSEPDRLSHNTPVGAHLRSLHRLNLCWNSLCAVPRTCLSSNRVHRGTVAPPVALVMECS